MASQSGASAMPEIRVPTLATLAGLGLGLMLGLILAGSDGEDAVLTVAEPVGRLWLQALKMAILPLVAGLLFTGIVQTVAAANAGVMARRTLGLFLLVLVSGAVLAAVLVPSMLRVAPVPAAAKAALAGQGVDPVLLPGPADFLGSLIPENIVEAAAADAMLPFIVFLTLLAFASMRLAEAPRRHLALLFEALAGAMMVVIGWILALAPLGVFALAFGLAVRSGSAAVGALAHYVLLVSAVGAVVLFAAYLLGVLAGRKKPGEFARALLPAQTVAISTQSSLASLPAMIDSCRRLGVRDSSSEFVLPLAVGLFRATSPAMNMAVVIYAASLSGVELAPAAMAAGALVALLVSLSTVSLPGTVSFIASVGPIAIAMGVPVEPLALLLAVEMLPDIMRTVANVTMNVAVTSVVDRGSAPD